MIISKRNFGLMLILTVAISPASAKKSSAPTPNLAASATSQIEIEQEQLPSSVPTVDASIKLNVAHSFTITPEQEAAIDANTTISLIDIQVQPGHDSKFQNGDKSFSVTQNYAISMPGINSIPITLKAKWGNGKFSISAKANAKAKDVAAPMPLKAVSDKISAALPLKSAGFKSDIAPRIENISTISTIIEFPSLPDYEVEAWMASDVTQSSMEAATAEGVLSTGNSESIKTRSFTTPPMP